jgi:ribA/ribD-fused uncharacterized protein
VAVEISVRSKAELIDFVNRGNKVKYVFFWGHRKPESGVSKSCFSQWYESSFNVDGKQYQTAEHFMMAEKARLFGDFEAEKSILASANPGAAKKFGRNVLGFNEAIWINNRFEIVVKANIEKFGQNPELKEFLLNTGDRVLVEASPVDRIWGIGLAEDNRDIENPNNWKGLNLLGFALMEVRERLVK